MPELHELTAAQLALLCLVWGVSASLIYGMLDYWNIPNNEPVAQLMLAMFWPISPALIAFYAIAWLVLVLLSGVALMGRILAEQQGEAWRALRRRARRRRA